MAITKSEGDPVVYMLAYGQFYAATVKATNGGDPPILVLEIEGKRVVPVHRSWAAWHAA